MGFVVRRYIYRYPHNNFPTPLVLALFFGSNIPSSLFIFKMFFRCHNYVYTMQELGNEAK